MSFFKKSIYKVVAVGLSFIIISLPISFNKIEVHAEVATLTVAGVAALITLLATAGVDFTNVAIDNNSDTTDTTNIVVSDGFIEQMAMSLTIAQIECLNKIGQNIDKDNNLVLQRDDYYLLSDWLSDFVCTNVNSEIVSIDGNFNGIYNYLTAYVCDCNKQTFKEDLFNFLNTSSYVIDNGYYYIVCGMQRDKDVFTLYLGFSDFPDVELYKSSKYIFANNLMGCGYYHQTCSECGHDTSSQGQRNKNLLYYAGLFYD